MTDASEDYAQPPRDQKPPRPEWRRFTPKLYRQSQQKAQRVREDKARA